MALADWSPRRMRMVWLTGMVLQLAVIVVPTVLTVRRVRRDLPRIRREAANYHRQLAGERLADSVSRAQQVAAARADGEFQVRASGDTVFGIVGMPGSRLDPQRMAALRRSMRRFAAILLGVQFGAIPVALGLLTVGWLVARRRGAGTILPMPDPCAG